MMSKTIIQKFFLGFTLIEMVITVSLTALLFAVVSIFMRAPLESYANVINLGILIDSAESALQGLSNDLSNAVPKSIRTKTDNVNNRVAIEFIQTVEVIRYRGQTGSFLDFITPGSSTFDTIGLLQTAPSNSTCAAGNCRLIVNNTLINTGIYNSGNTDSPIDGLNVYSTSARVGDGAVTISPAGLSITFTGSNILIQSGGSPTNVLFANPSPHQKLYIADTPVTYICDLNTGLLTRYWGYTINPIQPIDPFGSTLISASNAPLAANISACSFAYTQATSTFNGVVNIALSLTLNSRIISNTTRLMQQVALKNSL